MTRLVWLLFLPSLTFSWQDQDRHVLFGKLTEKENELLQKQCGRPVPHYLPVQQFEYDGIVSRLVAPWAVQINVIRNPHSDIEEFICSGALISSRHVLTSASCLVQFTSKCANGILDSTENITQNELRIIVDEACNSVECKWLLSFKRLKLRASSVSYNTLYSGPACEEQQVERYGKHKFWQPRNNVAVITLSEEVTFNKWIYPICLNDKALSPGEKITLFGHEETNDYGDYIQLKEHRNTMASECKMDGLGFDKFCAEQETGFSCGTQTGGGHVVYDSDGRARLAAIVAGGPEYCDHFRKEYKAGRGPKPFDVHANVTEGITSLCSFYGICVNDEVAEAAKHANTNDWVTNVYHHD